MFDQNNQTPLQQKFQEKVKKEVPLERNLGAYQKYIGIDNLVRSLTSCSCNIETASLRLSMYVKSPEQDVKHDHLKNIFFSNSN